MMQKTNLRKLVILLSLLAMVFALASCAKTDTTDPNKPSKSGTTTPATTGTDSAMIPIPLVIPAPIVEGTPPNLSGIENLEEFVKENRAPFMVPAGTTNVAKGKPVTCSDEDMTDPLDKIVDGDMSGVDDSWVELGLFEQSITIDLQKAHEIYAIVVWHYHKQQRIYNDVVIQTADDQDFTVNVKNHFNNDTENVHGQGAGTDKKYIEKNEGRLVDAKGIKGRFVRLFSTGNNDNELNHYVEVAVYGKPVK